jgi:hypothetical protein
MVRFPPLPSHPSFLLLHAQLNKKQKASMNLSKTVQTDWYSHPRPNYPSRSRDSLPISHPHKGRSQTSAHPSSNRLVPHPHLSPPSTPVPLRIRTYRVRKAIGSGTHGTTIGIKSLGHLCRGMRMGIMMSGLCEYDGHSGCNLDICEFSNNSFWSAFIQVYICTGFHQSIIN